MSASVTAIVATHRHFNEHLPRTYPARGADVQVHRAALPATEQGTFACFTRKPKKIEGSLEAGGRCLEAGGRCK